MHIHRFHDAAAIALQGKGETRYMSADEAEKAGRALLAVAASIRREHFCDSQAPSVEFSTTEKTGQFKVDRKPKARTNRRIPKDWPVKPLRHGSAKLKAAIAARTAATCGTCGRAWDDSIVTSMTPAPSARCPFEQFH